MTIFELIILLLIASAGLTFTIVHAEIMDILKIRPFLQKFKFTKKLIKCSLCTGVYVGAFYSLLYLPFYYFPIFIFAASAVSFLFERFTCLLDDLILYLAKKDAK